LSLDVEIRTLVVLGRPVRPKGDLDDDSFLLRDGWTSLIMNLDILGLKLFAPASVADQMAGLYQEQLSWPELQFSSLRLSGWSFSPRRDNMPGRESGKCLITYRCYARMAAVAA
jgi:hypothetical protein